MFITIALALFGFITWLILRDWTIYVRLSPKGRKNILKKASELLALEKWEEAEITLRPLLKKQSPEKESLLLYVRILHGKKELEKALEGVEKGNRLFPEELLFRVEEGKILLELGKHYEAMAAFQVAMPILRKESDLLLLGRSYLHVKEAKKCWDLIEPLSQKSQSVPFFLLAGECLVELNREKEGLEFYKKALEKGGETHALLTLIAATYRKEKKYDAAEEVFRKILRQDPGNVTATLGLSYCIQERGYPLRALIFLQASNAWIKGDTRLYFQAGVLALMLSKFELAAELFHLIRAKGEISSQLLSFQAYSLEKLEKWQEAENIYLLMTELFPKEPSSYLSLAWLFGSGLSSQISKGEGVGFAEKALLLFPDKVSWECLSACEARQGNFSRALQIQEHLATLDLEKNDRLRRQKCLRKLRKELPLDDPSLLVHPHNLFSQRKIMA